MNLVQVLDEEEITPVVKGRHNGQISSPSKQLNSLELPEGSSFSGDQKNVPNDLATAQVPVASQVILPTRKGSRRKMDLKRAMIPKVGKSSVNIRKNQINRQDGAIHLKVRYSMCISFYPSFQILRGAFTNVLIVFWNYRTSFLVVYHLLWFADGVHLNGFIVQLTTLGLLKGSLWNI
jgi:hypothetical protein